MMTNLGGGHDDLWFMFLYLNIVECFVLYKQLKMIKKDIMRAPYVMVPLCMYNNRNKKF